jgi:hypothetical protein
MLLSDSSMATGEFFDLPFDVIEIILTFLVMGNGCDGKQCIRSCLAFMFCCKRAKSLMFQAKPSVKAVIGFDNIVDILDIPSRKMVNLLARWGVEFCFDNSINVLDTESLIQKKYSANNAFIMNVLPNIGCLFLSNLFQPVGVVYDFTRCHMSMFIGMKLSHLLKVNFSGSHVYNNISFNTCSFGYDDRSEFVMTMSGGTFKSISFHEDLYNKDHLCFPNGLGIHGLRHLIIENTGNIVATIKLLGIESCISFQQITLRGGIKLEEIVSNSPNVPVVDASRNDLIL